MKCPKCWEEIGLVRCPKCQGEISVDELKTQLQENLPLSIPQHMEERMESLKRRRVEVFR